MKVPSAPSRSPKNPKARYCHRPSEGKDDRLDSHYFFEKEDICLFIRISSIRLFVSLPKLDRKDQRQEGRLNPVFSVRWGLFFFVIGGAGNVEQICRSD